MRWWLVLAVIVAAAVVGSVAWSASAPDTACQDQTYSAFLDSDGSDTVATAEEALGDRLSDADTVTEEPNGDKGFHTVTFRGYDADGELTSRVVVEGIGDGGWRVARVDTCARQPLLDVGWLTSSVGPRADGCCARTTEGSSATRCLRSRWTRSLPARTACQGPTPVTGAGVSRTSAAPGCAWPRS